MTTLTAERPYRIVSIDILRGIVMIIMALDHTRDFFHIPAITGNPLDLTTTTPWLFFTRWITHFCAPTFVFLSGLSAFLSAQKKTKAEAGSFMIKRGLWLIFVEVAIITLGLTFNPFYNVIILQVIWAIGFSMVIVGLLMRTSFTTMLIIGLLLFFGHNIVDLVKAPQNEVASTLWAIFLTTPGRFIPIGSDHIVAAFYAILPWTGVMLLGYCAGTYFTKTVEATKRKRFLLVTGLAAIALFILLRLINIYGDPVPRAPQTGLLNNILGFINTTKYPPSLEYLCMTLGPSLVFLSLFENIKGKWTQVVSVYGRVPFFYYVLHFYLLHTILVIVFFATGHSFSEIATQQNPFLFRPDTLFGFRLPGVYLIWLSVVAILYQPCRWFDQYKKTHTQWWLKYL